MEFKLPYLLAMREQAPKMFNQLRKTGAMDAHLQEKSIEAHKMLDYLTENAPKLPGGLPEQPYLREAQHQVLEALIEFPSESPPPSDPLASNPLDRQAKTSP